MMKKLLVGYDGTESAKRALERAAGMAGDGVTLGVISVAPIVPGGPRSGGPFSPGDGPAEHQAELTEATEYLAGRGITPAAIAAAGDPAKAICEAAERDGYTTIVVGRRNLSAAKHLLLGSVSDGVAHHAGCDVLIVK
jgi:nucleotide-binding universal stress UspA family protein